MVEKLKNKNIIMLIIAVVVVAALSIYVFSTSETLSLEASTETEEGTMYDIEGVMAYYIEAMTNEDTLVYAQYTQDTSEDVDVTCFSCHDVETLQELFLSVDTEEIDEELATMLKYAKTTCLVCHGSYAELIELTADLELEEWYYLNPHETPESITYNHTANIS